jgi:hypothetical protein
MHQDKEEHDHLLGLLEISAMTLFAALAGQYRADGGEDSQVEEVLARMSVASFGTWVDAIGLLQTQCGNRKESSVGRQVAWELGRKAGYPAQRSAIEQVARLIGQEQPNLVFVQRLVVRDGHLICEANHVIGWDLDRTVHDHPAQPGVSAGNLYLCSEDGSPVLCLSPVLFYGLCQHCTYEPRVFLLRKAAVRPERGIPESCASVDYTCSICGNRFRVEDPMVTRAFLDLLRRPMPTAPETKLPAEQEKLPPTPALAPPETEPVPEPPSPPPPDRKPMVNPNVSMFLTLYTQNTRHNRTAIPLHHRSGIALLGVKWYNEHRGHDSNPPSAIRSGESAHP